MAPRKILEAEIWCAQCKSYYGKIFRTEVREGFYENSTEPASVQKHCSVCYEVLERK